MNKIKNVLGEMIAMEILLEPATELSAAHFATIYKLQESGFSEDEAIEICKSVIQKVNESCEGNKATLLKMIENEGLNMGQAVRLALRREELKETTAEAVESHTGKL